MDIVYFSTFLFFKGFLYGNLSYQIRSICLERKRKWKNKEAWESFKQMEEDGFVVFFSKSLCLSKMVFIASSSICINLSWTFLFFHFFFLSMQTKCNKNKRLPPQKSKKKKHAPSIPYPIKYTEHWNMTK